MRPWIFVAALAAVVSSGVAGAQTKVQLSSETKSATMLSAYDLDGEAADADQVVTVATLADSTTFAIAAQPDVCRLIDMTIVDADSSVTAGTVTFTGTDCLGYTRVCTFDFSVVATRGSGVKTLPVTTGPGGSSCYLKTVTSVVSSALTGEGGAGDTILAGYTTNSAVGWGTFGRLKAPGPNGDHTVDPFDAYPSTLKITTAGVSTTTVTSVGSNAAFTNVVSGDLLLFSVDGFTYEVLVTARASADSVTVSKKVTIPSGGAPFSFKHKYFSTDPTDRLWVDTYGWRAADFTWSIDANADTGGVVMSLQCSPREGVEFPSERWNTLKTVTTVTGSTQADITEAIDLSIAPFRYCRMGWSFGTGDDADAALEDINLVVVLSR